MSSSRGSHLAPGGEGNKRKTEAFEENKTSAKRRKAEPEEPAYYEEEAPARFDPEEQNPVKKHKGHTAGKVLLVILALFVAMGCIGLGTVLMITHGPSEQAKIMFVRTFLDTGTLQWVPSVFFSEDEVVRIAVPQFTAGGKKYPTEKEAAVSEVTFEPVPDDKPVVELVDITGASWHGKMIVVRDPSLVRLAVPESLEESGRYGLSELRQVEEFVEQYGAIGGITAGGFDMESGRPSWYIIKNGKVVLYGGGRTCFVGLTADHRLVVGEFSEQEALDRGVVEGICWPPLLIVDGVKQTGMGGGYNPRAAIGQKADGTIILVLIEGRMISSLGATMDDLADFMEEQGCINACNLDSGRSSIMVFNGEPVTKVAIGAGIQTENRAVPNAFVVMPEGWTDD